MITSLSFGLLLLCQEPIGDILRAVHVRGGLEVPVEAALKKAAQADFVRIRGYDFDGLQKELETSGLDSLELGLERLGFQQGVQPVDEAFRLVARAYGLGRFPSSSIRILDLQGFNQEMEYSYRALRKALGPGRDLKREAARFHTVVGQISDLPIADALSRAQEARLREHLDRISVVDTAEILRLAARVVQAAMQLD